LPPALSIFIAAKAFATNHPRWVFSGYRGKFGISGKCTYLVWKSTFAFGREKEAGYGNTPQTDVFF
jgi:hypothetical protein